MHDVNIILRACNQLRAIQLTYREYITNVSDGGRITRCMPSLTMFHFFVLVCILHIISEGRLEETSLLWEI